MSNFEERESIVLENEGQKIFGVMHMPKGVAYPPSVLICHGLGGHKTGRYRVYVELAEALVKNGIAAIRFDFRGSGDSEGEFKDMTLRGEILDAIKMLKLMQADKRLDAGRIGIFGRSLGGAVAVHTAAEFGNIRSMALWAPIFSGDQWLPLWNRIQGGIATEHESNEMRRINGQVAGLPFWSEMFSMRIDEELKALRDIPILIIHGDKDELVSPEHSIKYHAERRHAQARTELVHLPEGDHDFTHSDERAFAVGLTAKYFAETLS